MITPAGPLGYPLAGRTLCSSRRLQPFVTITYASTRLVREDLMQQLARLLIDAGAPTLS